MTRPLIGITTHATGAPHRDALDRLRDQIIYEVERAGGLPVVIPPGLPEPALRGLFERMDGLLLSGGGDVDPTLYGAAPGALTGGVDVARDQAERELARWSLDAAKPIFGICRGVQVLNVACGGTLYQDIGEYVGAQRHTFYPDLPFDLRAHAVQIEAGSRLGRIVARATLEVNSLHHQACREVAAGLRVVARAPDGLIEALEALDHPFALAVQWHPEALPEMAETQALFGALVAASRQTSTSCPSGASVSTWSR